MKELGRFPRTTTKFKGKTLIETQTITNKEKLHHTYENAKHAYNNANIKLVKTGTKLRGFQDKLQKTFPGVNDFNKKLEQEYNTNKTKDKDKKNWWEY